MRKIFAILLFLFVLPKAETQEIIETAEATENTEVAENTENTETAEKKYQYIPLYYAFDGILLNSGKTLIHNYGINSALMVTGTYTLIQTESDWKWNRFAYRHKPITEIGLYAYYVGFTVPFAAPLALYGIGFGLEDLKLQTAAVAVTQASLISTALTSSIKAFTGRKHSDVWDGGKKDYSGDFAFGFMKRGAFAGWPSGHASAAWAMAATLTEFYNSIPLAAGLYGYALYISASASVSFHWFSDVCAGALFGYTIGKTTGRYFNKEYNKENQLSLVVLPDRVMIVKRF
jgi:PAP2 (acid phosphatase) superfamily protein